MNIPLEVEKTEREIKDLESRVITVRDAILNLERELILLNIKEKALSDNLRNLKKISTIVSVSEYRRSKEDLKKTITRLETVNKEKRNLEEAMKKIVLFLNKTRIKLNELLELVGDNVLEFKNKNFK